MPRSIRIEYPGAFYHVTARGNRREDIFQDEEDRRFLLKTLSEACGMTGWRIHAWVFMGNHYHLLIETPEANLVEGMKWLQNTYTRRFNARHRLWGRLFGDRYKAMLVEGSGYYYETLLDYIHLNPVRAGLIKMQKGQSVIDYAWSSVAQGYALPAKRRAKWLAVETGLLAFGYADTTAGRRRFVERLDKRAGEDEVKDAGVPRREAQADRRRSHLRHGWYWGSQAFAERMLALGEVVLKKRRNRVYRSSLESRAHGQKEAERLLVEGLRAAGLSAASLVALKGSDPRKVAIARVIWEKTTVNMKWLAEKLSMKSAANASQQLRRWEQRKEKPSKSLREWMNLSRNVA